MVVVHGGQWHPWKQVTKGGLQRRRERRAWPSSATDGHWVGNAVGVSGYGAKVLGIGRTWPNPVALAHEQSLLLTYLVCRENQ